MPVYFLRPQEQHGFSYVGLLILLAIIGTLSATTLTAGSAMQRRAAEDELLFIGEQFQMALNSYANASPPGAPRYPAQLGDLLRDPRYPGVRRHLRKLYVDPLTGRADWGTVAAPQGGIYGVYSRSGEQPIRVSGFADNFAHFDGARTYAEWVFLGENLHSATEAGRQGHTP
jgi:type II secretory pathway pseudopilin PulG